MKQLQLEKIGFVTFRWEGKCVEIFANEITNILIGYNLMSNRIITAWVNAKPHKISFVQFYEPISTATEKGVDVFYSQPEELTDEFLNRDMKIGDVNAKVGKSITKSETHGQFRLGLRNEHLFAILHTSLQ